MDVSKLEERARKVLETAYAEAAPARGAAVLRLLVRACQDDEGEWAEFAADELGEKALAVFQDLVATPEGQAEALRALAAAYPEKEPYLPEDRGAVETTAAALVEQVLAELGYTVGTLNSLD